MPIESLGNSFNSLNKIQNNLFSINKKLSSGKKSIEEDPSGIAAADRIDAHTRGLSQALRNVDQAHSVLDVAQSGLSGVQDSLAKVKELTLQYQQANPEDKQIIKDQIDSELQGIDQVANAKDANGNQLLNGNQKIDVQVSDQVGDTITISGSDLSLQGLGLSGFDPSDPNALKSIDAAAQQVSQAETSLASTSNSLDASANNLSSLVVSSESARSRIEDADFAKELSEKTKNEILNKQGIAVIAQANVSAGALLGLLKK